MKLSWKFPVIFSLAEQEENGKIQHKELIV